MKKLVILVLLLVFALPAVARAAENRQDNRGQENRQEVRQETRQENSRHDWSHPAYRSENWHRTIFPADVNSPFRWHEPFSSARERFGSFDYRLDRIDDRDWDDRFPGLNCYRWRDQDLFGRGFWYQGERISDCVLFFDEWDQMVGIGFMFNGVFLFLRDDMESYEYNDPFFFEWWRRH